MFSQGKPKKGLKMDLYTIKIQIFLPPGGAPPQPPQTPPVAPSVLPTSRHYKIGTFQIKQTPNKIPMWNPVISIHETV